MPAQNTEPLDDTPAGLKRRWSMELDAAKREQETWKKRGEEVVKRYTDEREGRAESERRLNLFWADTQIKQALLYGKVPKVDASRRHQDQNDDVARVAGEELNRLLNSDIEKGSDSYASALWNCLEDWLLPGLAQVKLRYSADFTQVPEVAAMTSTDPNTGIEYVTAPAVPAHEKKTDEHVNVDYVYWKNFRWSPARTWEDVRWVAFGEEHAPEKLVEMFGEEMGHAIPLDAKNENQTADEARNDPGARAMVWEIWDKPTKKVYRYSAAYPTILDVRDDFLGLDDFFPCPRPLTSNTTTSKFLPVPDYYIFQSLYQGCDELFRRICLLEEAIAVRGTYDATVPELANILNSRAENFMVPATNFQMLAEKGGLQGAMFFLPLEMLAATLDKLRAQLAEKISLLQQVTGMSDIMRGQAQSHATATEQAIKAKYGSVRSQKKQEEFSRFASDILKLKGEIISKHFDPETIVRYSNLEGGPDAQLAIPAAQLIKDKYACYRIEVQPEQISMPDLASIKQEKTEFMGAFSGILQQVMGAAQTAPELVPMILELTKWSLAGFRGANTAEGIVDQGINQWMQAQQQAQQQPPKPDPRLQAQMAKSQADERKVGVELQADLMRTKAETEAEVMRQRAQATSNVQEAYGIERAKLMAGLENMVVPRGAGE